MFNNKVSGLFLKTYLINGLNVDNCMIHYI